MFDVKFSMFFDRPRVQRRVKDGTRSVLAKAGSFVRRDAKGSMGKSRKIARDGQAPRVHAGQLKDLLFFGYDDASDSVVVGPQLLRSQQGDVTVPHLLEFGGSTRRRDRRGRVRLYNYRAFPYMAPALKANISKFPTLFAGAIKD